ncbi:MAG TPA: radical SAM protein [Thermoleophilia bacterium]|nr:radical SAM protein [Thermoleophilia bacterium]HQG03615.1 radical SAM protein [Thermoleophilia bacterium]HQJ97246.1 radical SAM protein [Thermoleophilia bacterium]
MATTAGLYGKLERRVINQMLEAAASGNKKSIVRAFKLAESITPDQYKGAVRFVRDKVEEDHPALSIARHVSQELSPKCRDRFIECLIVNTLLRGVAKRKDFIASAPGVWAPTTILMSPTMRCNLTCKGCYAGEYPASKDLEPEVLQRIVDEGTEMGVYLYTLLGGEPFFYDGLFDLAANNQECYFQVFTNGTLIDEEVVDRLAELGNIAPMLSLEGDEASTDARRGKGVYRHILDTMDLLGERGVVFGYSATVTRENWRMLISDEWVDPLVARGAVLSWHFLYMPIGRSPDTSMMLTPEERNEFREGILRIRNTKAMFPVDFWGDAPYVNGCIAGKHYVHINSEGWVEPCIFTHFATDNIHDTTLIEAFNSPYFREIRSRQPFSDNLLKPCMLIDNPNQSREIMAATGARPTHPGAESLFTELRDPIDKYAAEVERVYAPIWSCMVSQKAGEREEAAAVR